MVAAFQVLINCLEESDALLPGAFPEALRVYMEMMKSKKGQRERYDACSAARHSDGYAGLIYLAGFVSGRTPSPSKKHDLVSPVQISHPDAFRADSEGMRER
jgi:hypothetical protein